MTAKARALTRTTWGDCIGNGNECANNCDEGDDGNGDKGNDGGTDGDSDDGDDGNNGNDGNDGGAGLAVAGVEVYAMVLYSGVGLLWAVFSMEFAAQTEKRHSTISFVGTGRGAPGAPLLHTQKRCAWRTLPQCRIIALKIEPLYHVNPIGSNSKLSKT